MLYKIKFAVHELSLGMSADLDVVALQKKHTKPATLAAVDTTCPSNV
jgi:hypothetical protein